MLSKYVTNFYQRIVKEVLLLLCFTKLFNILGHQRRFRHRAWKSDKLCSEALISAWGSFTCRKSTTHGFTRDFYALKKSIDPRPGLNPRTSYPEASMITTVPPGSTNANFLPGLSVCSDNNALYLRSSKYHLNLIVQPYSIGGPQATCGPRDP